MTTTEDEINAVYIKRLRMLRDIAVPFARKLSARNKLRWAFWFRGNPEHSCGSYMCLMGCLPVLPEFRDEGWRLRKMHGDSYLPTWGGHDDDAAAANYFDMSYDEVNKVFGTAKHGSLSTRAKRIDRIIERRLKGNA